MSHEFDFMSIFYYLANYSNLEIFAYYKSVPYVIIPKENQI